VRAHSVQYTIRSNTGERRCARGHQNHPQLCDWKRSRQPATTTGGESHAELVSRPWGSQADRSLLAGRWRPARHHGTVRMLHGSLRVGTLDATTSPILLLAIGGSGDRLSCNRCRSPRYQTRKHSR